MLKLFRFKSDEADAPVGPIADVNWARNRKGRFHNVLRLDPIAEGLAQKGGVFVIWHGGVKPDWLYVGMSDDLARDLEPLLERDELEEHVRHGVYVTWAFVSPEYRRGVFRYLNETLTPEIENPAAKSVCSGPGRAVPIAVYPPGKGDPAQSHAAQNVR